MAPLIHSLVWLGFLSAANAITAWQKSNYTFPVPESPANAFSADSFSTKADAIAALKTALGNVTIAGSGDYYYGQTIARVWTNQRKTYPDYIVYPETPEHVSILMQFYSKANSFWGDGFAIMGGGHFDTGGAQSPSVIMDLQRISNTEIVTNPPKNSSEYAILKIGGGAEAGDVYDALDGTGWAFLGTRILLPFLPVLTLSRSTCGIHWCWWLSFRWRYVKRVDSKNRRPANTARSHRDSFSNK